MSATDELLKRTKRPIIIHTVSDEMPERIVIREHVGDGVIVDHWYVPERTTTRNGKIRKRYGRDVPLCECCGYAIGDARYNYCPSCGARIVK